jgi:hypothetical protein
MSKAEAIIKLMIVIIESVKEMGEQGAPEGPMYAAFMHYGVTLGQFNLIMSFLVEHGFLRRSGHLLYWLKDAPVKWQIAA